MSAAPDALVGTSGLGVSVEKEAKHQYPAAADAASAPSIQPEQQEGPLAAPVKGRHARYLLSPLAVLAARAEARALLVDAGEMDLGEAVFGLVPAFADMLDDALDYALDAAGNRIKAAEDTP
jgi:hypothetical protein